jgi:hypothetical protein
MLLKVNNEFLDFDEDVEIERQVKLFEDISATAGDFSYSFNIPKTTPNLSKLGFPFVDVSGKVIYKNIFCDVLDNEGVVLYKGKLKVQKITDVIECSFLSGNYNWFDLISGNIADLDFSVYDTELTDSNIVNYSINTSGLTFPVMDIGALGTRSWQSMMVEDFNGCMYVKTIFNKIFNSEGIKLKGELLNDFLYQNQIVVCNNKNDAGIQDRSSYANKTSNQTVVDLAAYTVILFQNDSTFPFYDGDLNNYSTSTYRFTADIKMSVKVEVNLAISMNTQLNRQWYRINKNGSTFREYVNRFGPGPTPPTSYNINVTMLLEAGDFIQIDIKSVDALGVNTGVQSGSTFKVTPIYIYKVFGNSSVPRWSKQEFIANILNQFNVVSDYNPFTKELTFNFFDKIRHKTPTDISEYVKVVETDFEEFISNFGRNNIFSYQESNNSDLKDYNVKNTVRYGNGVLEVDNDFIEEEIDLVSSDFTAPISYINGMLDASLEKVDMVELEESESTTFASVSDADPYAQFVIAADIFEAGQLVRISDCTYPEYNGDWVVEATGGAQLFLEGLSFSQTASGTVSRLDYKYTSNDDVFVMINLPAYDMANYAGAGYYHLLDNNYTTLAYAYFNLLNTNRSANTAFKQGLSFGSVNNPLFYQKTLLDTYWKDARKVLSDPVKVICEAYFPSAVFKSLSPLNPVYIKTKDTTNLFYINRITGYKNSHSPCTVELIKL